MQEMHVQEQNFKGESEKGTGIPLSIVTVQESPVTKDCITTTSSRLQHLEVSNISGPMFVSILSWVLYATHEAQPLLQMHDVLHCGRFES